MLKRLYSYFKMFLSVSFILCLVLLLASYTQSDASFNTASSMPTKNLLGSVGAHLADLFMQIFGWSSWLIVLFLIASVFYKVLKHQRRFLWVKRIISFFLIFLFCFLMKDSDKGGSIGILIYQKTPFLLGYQIFLLWSVFVLGMIFVLDVPVKKISMYLWYYIRVLSRRFVNKSQPLPVLEIKQEDKQKTKKVKEVKAPVAKKVKNTTAPVVQKSKADDGFVLPPASLLDEPKAQSKDNLTREMMDDISRKLEEILAQFGVKGEVVRVSPGPVITLYEFEPAAGVKASRVIGLAEDMARAMSVVSVRMAVVPGSSVIGIEIPNKTRQTVFIKELVDTNAFMDNKGILPMILGKNIGGNPVFADLAKMPHLLVAGTTGSGKSVGINTMILSLLYRFTPSQCKLIMVDPKMLELSVYNGIPHLLTPVVTEPGKAIVALKWVVKEMDDRYRAMATIGVRNIEGYNKKISVYDIFNRFIIRINKFRMQYIHWRMHI